MALQSKNHRQIVAPQPIIVDRLKRGLLPKWASNLISDSHLIIPVCFPLHQVRYLPVVSQFTVALCGVIQPHKVHNLVQFVPKLAVRESFLFSACHNIVVLCLTKSSVQAPEERTKSSRDPSFGLPCTSGPSTTSTGVWASLLCMRTYDVNPVLE